MGDAPQQDSKGRFLPGNSGFGGRPKGARSKLGEDFLQKLYADFKEHGETVITKVRDDKPDVYLKVVASILPKEFEPSEDALDMLAALLGRIDGRTRSVIPVEGETLQ